MQQYQGVQPVLQRNYNKILYPAVAAVGVFAIVPLMGMIALAFTDFHLIKGWGRGFGLENFIRMAEDRRFIASISVMLMLSVFGVIFQVALGTLIAVGLEKIVPKWRFMRGIFMVPFVVPAVAVALIWLSLFTPTLSPINAFFDIFGITVPAFLTTQYGAIAAIVIADTWASYPFVMLLILQAFPADFRDDKRRTWAVDASNQLLRLHPDLPVLERLLRCCDCRVPVPLCHRDQLLRRQGQREVDRCVNPTAA